jgi:hypothetical protein
MLAPNKNVPEKMPLGSRIGKRASRRISDAAPWYLTNGKRNASGPNKSTVGPRFFKFFAYACRVKLLFSAALRHNPGCRTVNGGRGKWFRDTLAESRATV